MRLPAAISGQHTRFPKRPWFHIDVASIHNIGDQQVDCRRGSALNQCTTRTQPEEYRHVKHCSRLAYTRNHQARCRGSSKTRLITIPITPSISVASAPHKNLISSQQPPWQALPTCKINRPTEEGAQKLRA